MKSGNGLFRSRNEVFVVLAIHNLVQLLVELLELRRLRHVILHHELRRLQGGVTTLREKLEAVVDDSLVQEHAPLAQEISPVADHLHAPFRIVTVQSGQNLVMG